MKVCMIVADGFEEMEAMASFSVMTRGGIEVDLYGLNGAEALSKHGVKVCGLKPFALFKDEDYAALVLPGGPHYAALEESEAVQSLIRDFLAKGKKVAAICASPTILGHMGLRGLRRYRWPNNNGQRPRRGDRLRFGNSEAIKRRSRSQGSERGNVL